MIYCACGCGHQLEEFDSRNRTRRFIRFHNLNGINNPFFGKKHSEETKLKMSINHYDSKKENNPMWNGGRKLSDARSHANRRGFKFNYLNECKIDGWVGHHINKEHVLFIPEDLHKSIWHSIIKNVNMDIINDKVVDWYLNIYCKEYL